MNHLNPSNNPEFGDSLADPIADVSQRGGRGGQFPDALDIAAGFFVDLTQA